MKIATILAGACAGLAALTAAAPALAACQFNKLGELTVDMTRGVPLIDIVINGKTAKMRIDTGTTSTFLTAPGAASLGVAPDTSPPVRFSGPAGETTARRQTLRNVVLGRAFAMGQMDILLLDQAGPQVGDIVGSLGLDVLAASDVEYDLANNRIAFFAANDCGKQPLAYWGTNFGVVDTRKPSPTRPQVMTTVKVNDKALRAQLLTGSPYSLIDRPSALVAGVSPTTPGVEALGQLDFGGPRDAWIGPFSSFAIGDEEIKNVRIGFANLFNDMRFEVTGSRLGARSNDQPSMLLGGDFLKAHRVLVANSQGKMYFTYNGGAVFKKPEAGDAAAAGIGSADFRDGGFR